MQINEIGKAADTAPNGGAPENEPARIVNGGAEPVVTPIPIKPESIPSVEAEKAGKQAKRKRGKDMDIIDKEVNEAAKVEEKIETSPEQAIVERVFNGLPTEENGATIWPPPLYLMGTAGDAERYYMRYRWQNQWRYYDDKASETKRNYQYLQLLIGIGSVAVPVLLGFQGAFTVVATIVSLIVAAAAAIENVKKYGDGWRSFRAAAEALQREKSLYDVGAGPYRISKRPFLRFVERAEEIIAQQNGQFMQRGEDQPQQQGQQQQGQQASADKDDK